MKSAPVFVEVKTFLNADPDTIETSRVINHSDSLHRQWLEKHTHWALRNDRGIEIAAAEE
jgi:hypothetical protein